MDFEISTAPFPSTVYTAHYNATRGPIVLDFLPGQIQFHGNDIPGSSFFRLFVFDSAFSLSPQPINV